MREMWGEFWITAEQYPEAALVIPTNGILRKDGSLVMGAGLAKQAADRYPTLARRWGRHVRINGNTPDLIRSRSRWIWSMPTKHHWRDRADLELIIESAKAMADFRKEWRDGGVVLMPRVGCGLGQLDWGIVRAVLDPVLDDDFLVVSVQP